MEHDLRLSFGLTIIMIVVIIIGMFVKEKDD